MAKNLFGTDITARSGRLNARAGGNVFLKNGVMRVYSTPTNPRTEAQTDVRAAFLFLTSAWSQLTDEQRTAWETARTDAYWLIADPFTGVSRPANSGKALFIQVNYNLLVAADSVKSPSVTTTNPPSVEPTDEFTITSLVADASSNTLVLTYTQTGANDALIVRVTPPVSPGNMRLTSVKSELRNTAPAGTSPYTVPHTSDYTGRTGMKVWYVIEAIGSVSGKKRVIATGSTVIQA